MHQDSSQDLEYSGGDGGIPMSRVTFACLGMPECYAENSEVLIKGTRSRLWACSSVEGAPMQS